MLDIFSDLKNTLEQGKQYIGVAKDYHGKIDKIVNNERQETSNVSFENLFDEGVKLSTTATNPISFGVESLLFLRKADEWGRERVSKYDKIMHPVSSLLGGESIFSHAETTDGITEHETQTAGTKLSEPEEAQKPIQFDPNLEPSYQVVPFDVQADHMRVSEMHFDDLMSVEHNSHLPFAYQEHMRPQTEIELYTHRREPDGTVIPYHQASIGSQVANQDLYQGHNYYNYGQPNPHIHLADTSLAGSYPNYIAQG